MYHSPIYSYWVLSENMQDVHHMSCSQRNFSIGRYRPLNFNGFQGFPNIVPNGVREHLPKFLGKILELAYRYLHTFMDLMGGYGIRNEDVFMNLFVQSLKEDTRDWFSYFPMFSISSWNEFLVSFIEQFGERINPISVRKKNLWKGLIRVSPNF